jgi:DNA-directed RNA polymerase alpha subunit
MYTADITTPRTTSIDSLDISIRALNVLVDQNIETIGELIQHTAETVRGWKHSGPKLVKQLETALAEHGYALRSPPAPKVKAQLEHELAMIRARVARDIARAKTIESQLAVL